MLLVVTDLFTTCVEVISRVMTYTQVVETSVTTNNSPSQDYANPDDQPTTKVDSFKIRLFTAL